VNNDFHQPRTIFEVLTGLEIRDLDKIPAPEPKANGVHPSAANGVHHSTNGGEALTVSQ